MPLSRTRAAIAATAALAALSGAAASGAATSRDPGRSGGASGPDTIALPPGWQPEGIARGPANQLYVGSIPTGRVLRVDPRTGRQEVVVPQREGRAAIGLKVTRGLIVVAGGRTGHAFFYDVRTGADVADVPLTADPSFVNDVTIAPDAAWFTDSVNQRLYRVALGEDGPAGTATALPITGDLQYDADPATFEANGIASADGGRTLLVVQSRTGGLFRVDPATGASTAVPLTGGDSGRLPNADGILLEGRTLYVVQNRSNQIAVVRLARDLERGTVERVLTDRDLDVPTTVARVRGALYTVNARFGTPATPTTPYHVVRVGDRHGHGGRGGHRERAGHRTGRGRHG